MVPGLTVVVVVAGPPTGTLGTPGFVVVVVAGAVVVVLLGAVVVVVGPGSRSTGAVVVVVVESTVWAAAGSAPAPIPAIKVTASRVAVTGDSR